LLLRSQTVTLQSRTTAEREALTQKIRVEYGLDDISETETESEASKQDDNGS